MPFGRGTHGRKRGRKHTVERALPRREPWRERHQRDRGQTDVQETSNQFSSHASPQYYKVTIIIHVFRIRKLNSERVINLFKMISTSKLSLTVHKAHVLFTMLHSLH